MQQVCLIRAIFVLHGDAFMMYLRLASAVGRRTRPPFHPFSIPLVELEKQNCLSLLANWELDSSSRTIWNQPVLQRWGIANMLEE